MIGSTESSLSDLFWIAGGALFAVLFGTIIWLSPFTKLVDEFAKFRRQGRRSKGNS